MVAVTLGSLRDVGYLLRVVAWTLAAFVQATAMLWVGFVALGSDVGLAEAVAFYVLLQLATYLPLDARQPRRAGAGVRRAGGRPRQRRRRRRGRLGAGAGDGVIALVALALPLGGVQALRASRAVPAASAS